jgi:hypothetical protein
MLHNPFYTGIIRLAKRGESFQGAHTPLIPTALFDRVQNVMTGKHRPKSKIYTFRYRAMIAHVDCTRRLTGEIHKGRFVYYRCHGRLCKGVAVPERVIDRAIAEKMLRIACTPEDMRDLRDLVENERSRQSADTRQDESSLRMLIVKCDDRLARLTDALLDGVISKELFDQRNARLLGERSGLQDRIAALGDEAVWLKQYREFELKNNQLLRYQTLTDEEIRDLVSALCSNFGLEGKEPTIALRFPYKEIAQTHGVHLGGPRKGDVRTMINVDTMSTITPHQPTRAQKIFDILHSVVDVSVNDNGMQDAP